MIGKENEIGDFRLAKAGIHSIELSQEKISISFSSGNTIKSKDNEVLQLQQFFNEQQQQLLQSITIHLQMKCSLLAELLVSVKDEKKESYSFLFSSDMEKQIFEKYIQDWIKNLNSQKLEQNQQTGIKMNQQTNQQSKVQVINSTSQITKNINNFHKRRKSQFLESKISQLEANMTKQVKTDPLIPGQPLYCISAVVGKKDSKSIAKPTFYRSLSFASQSPLIESLASFLNATLSHHFNGIDQQFIKQLYLSVNSAFAPQIEKQITTSNQINTNKEVKTKLIQKEEQQKYNQSFINNSQYSFPDLNSSYKLCLKTIPFQISTQQIKSTIILPLSSYIINITYSLSYISSHLSLFSTQQQQQFPQQQQQSNLLLQKQQLNQTIVPKQQEINRSFPINIKVAMLPVLPISSSSSAPITSLFTSQYPTQQQQNTSQSSSLIQNQSPSKQQPLQLFQQQQSQQPSQLSQQIQLPASNHTVMIPLHFFPSEFQRPSLRSLCRDFKVQIMDIFRSIFIGERILVFSKQSTANRSSLISAVLALAQMFVYLPYCNVDINNNTNNNIINNKQINIQQSTSTYFNSLFLLPRVFPYVSFTDHNFSTIDGYLAGTQNEGFAQNEQLWDLLVDLDEKRLKRSKYSINISEQEILQDKEMDKLKKNQKNERKKMKKLNKREKQLVFIQKEKEKLLKLKEQNQIIDINVSSSSQQQQLNQNKQQLQSQDIKIQPQIQISQQMRQVQQELLKHQPFSRDISSAQAISAQSNQQISQKFNQQNNVLPNSNQQSQKEQMNIKQEQEQSLQMQQSNLYQQKPAIKLLSSPFLKQNAQFKPPINSSLLNSQTQTTASPQKSLQQQKLLQDQQQQQLDQQQQTPPLPLQKNLNENQIQSSQQKQIGLQQQKQNILLTPEKHTTQHKRQLSDPSIFVESSFNSKQPASKQDQSKQRFISPHFQHCSISAENVNQLSQIHSISPSNSHKHKHKHSQRKSHKHSHSNIRSQSRSQSSSSADSHLSFLSSSSSSSSDYYQQVKSQDNSLSRSVSPISLLKQPRSHSQLQDHQPQSENLLQLDLSQQEQQIPQQLDINIVKISQFFPQTSQSQQQSSSQQQTLSKSQLMDYQFIKSILAGIHMDKLNEEQVRYKFHRYFRNLASLSVWREQWPNQEVILDDLDNQNNMDQQQQDNKHGKKKKYNKNSKIFNKLSVIECNQWRIQKFSQTVTGIRYSEIAKEQNQFWLEGRNKDKDQEQKQNEKESKINVNKNNLEKYNIEFLVETLKYNQSYLLPNEILQILVELNEYANTEENIEELISFFPHIDGGLQPIAMFMFHPVKEVLTAAREILAKIAVNKFGRRLVDQLNLFFFSSACITL